MEKSCEDVGCNCVESTNLDSKSNSGLTISEMCVEAYETAKGKGWWDFPRTELECHALIHTEIAEATAAYRHNESEKQLEELADAVIRIADLCGRNGWDLERAIKTKMEFNKTRPYRHGGLSA